VLWTRQIAPESPSWACFPPPDPHKIPIDPNGNLATKTEGSDSWTYTWNAENQLTKVEKNSVEQARFSYDPLGRRVEKVAAGVTTSYTYDAESILREARGAVTLRYVHGPRVDEPLAVDDGTALSYLQADALGSIVGSTNGAGAVTVTRQYDTWGNQQIGASDPGYAFTGREWDPEAGLYYYRARYFDAKSGRFLSEDPLGLDAGVNFYAYVRNNPVSASDPFGLKDCPVSSCMQKCLEQIFGEPIPNVRVMTNTKVSWTIGLFGSAVSHPNSIKLPRKTDCDDFFDNSWWVLHEYYHVVRQHRAERPAHFSFGGYIVHHNKHEKPPNDYARANEQALQDCLSKCNQCTK
jgi:RHS repeat-associated protein